MSWRPMVKTDGDAFYGNALRFATKEEAEGSADALMMRWFAVTDTKAEESTDPVNYRFDLDTRETAPIRKDEG